MPKSIKKRQTSSPQKLKRVIRLDSLPLNQTYFTPEGYLVDRPILTSIGIFEYTNADGSVRRELRLPEDVFDPESLKSYRGAPIIITHDAGLITKDNVAEEQIGTIMSEGYRSGNDVKAEIIIHDTDDMKSCGYKELSLGYNLDLDETPGMWHGEPYDAIQRNIRINHLALVKEARAGEQARLNIDGRDAILKGGKSMKKKTSKKSTTRTRRADSLLSPEELQLAIEEYKAHRAQREQAQVDSDEEEIPVTTAEEAATEDQVNLSTVEIQIEAVKDRQDRRDEEDDPATLKAAKGVIAEQSNDIGVLFDIIDTLLAEREFLGDDAEAEAEAAAETGAEETNADDDEEVAAEVGTEAVTEEANTDDDEEETGEVCADDDEEIIEESNEDDDDDEIPTATLNADSIDRIVRERVAIAKAASALNMDGLENIKPMKAKKTIIKAVRPGIRLDGKSASYINALFDLSCQDIQNRSRRNADYQVKQMFNRDARSAKTSRVNSTESARDRMIKRMQQKQK